MPRSDQLLEVHVADVPGIVVARDHHHGRLDAVLVGGAPDVGPLAIQGPLELRGGRRDVVGEEELILERDANALHVDAPGRVVAAAEDGSDVRTLQLVVAGEA